MFGAISGGIGALTGVVAIRTLGLYWVIPAVLVGYGLGYLTLAFFCGQRLPVAEPNGKSTVKRDGSALG